MLRSFFPELVISTDLLSFEHLSVLLFCSLILKQIWRRFIWWQLSFNKIFFAVNATMILFNTKICMPRIEWCKISFVWSAVPVIKMFRKGESINILTILHVHRRLFRAVSMDTRVPDIQQSRFAGRNLSRLYVILMKRSSKGVSFFCLPDHRRSATKLVCPNRWIIW